MLVRNEKQKQKRKHALRHLLRFYSVSCTGIVLGECLVAKNKGSMRAFM